MLESTGVRVSDEANSQWITFRFAEKQPTFMIFKIQNMQEIVTEFTSGNNEVFQTFLDKLPENECRFAVYSFDFTTKDGQAMNKMVSISWLPSTGKVKERILYTASRDVLHRTLSGVTTRINATDLDELTEEIVLEACRKFT
jgi:cofilin